MHNASFFKNQYHHTHKQITIITGGASLFYKNNHSYSYLNIWITSY